MQFCQTQNWLISSVANVMGGYLLNITDGTYWVSAIRGVSYTSLQGEWQIKFRKNAGSNHIIFLIYGKERCPTYFEGSIV